MPPDPKILLDRQQAFGYTQEDLKFFLGPRALSGQEPVGGMGRDIPQAVLSRRPQLRRHRGGGRGRRSRLRVHDRRGSNGGGLTGNVIVTPISQS